MMCGGVKIGAGRGKKLERWAKRRRGAGNINLHSVNVAASAYLLLTRRSSQVREGKNQKGGIIGASACALGGVVFLFGGSLWGGCCVSIDAQTDFHNCYWSSKDAGMSWSKVMSTEREFLRSSMTATAVKRRNEIVVVGGWDGDDAVGESKSDDRKIVDTYIIV